MEHRPVTPPVDLRRDLTVADIRSTIVDVPTVRQHKLSQLAVSAQSYVIVEIRLANGATGVGEAATLGGPRWSEESVEGIKAVIDAHLAPARDRRRRQPVRSGGRPHGRGREAQQRRQGRDRERALRRGRPHARRAGGAAARRSRCASGCRSSGRLPRAIRRRRSRRRRRSSPRACTTASRSRSARSRLRTTSPGCAGSRRRSRGARR